ncbi:MFS transporter [Aquibacillus sediminis]|uniref:MFS transporter n=1 Tax=Aquibacillus sediminis TaxID=2574734 RepID=UPI001107EE1E|nr:MFS transporter [Aquibacillus sediminis]
MTKPTTKSWLFVLTIGLGTLLNPLNSSMISVALTRIQHEFQLTFTDVSWLISIFYIASAVGQPVMGKLSDMFGPKRLFLTGLSLVALTSILAPLSPNYVTLLGFRALQAIGSSTLFPSGMAMIRSSITENQGKALSTIAVFSSTSAAFGPSIAGFLIQSWNWPAIFVINLPFIIVSFVLSITILPNTGKNKIDLTRIDFGGISLFVVGVTTLILFLLSIVDQVKWWAIIVAILSFVCMYVYETRRRDPFIDLKALKNNKNVSFIYLHFMSINIIFYCYFFGLPTFLLQVREYSERTTGLIMLAMAGMGVFVTPFVGRWIDRSGAKLTLLTGAISLMVGTALLLTVHDTTPLWWLLIIMAIIGMSNSFNNISLQISLYSHVNKEETASAAGLYQTSRYLGSIFSSCILGILFNDYLDVAHLHMVVMICLIFSVLVLYFAIRLPGKKLVTSKA